MLYQTYSRAGLLPSVLQELQPYPGRLDFSARIALVCVLVVVTAMALQVPEAALSCYFVFFAARPDSGAGIITAVGVLAGITFAIGLGILCLMVIADSPILRLAMVGVFTFGGMYLAQASKAGPPFGTVAMIFAFIMTLYDVVPVPELLVRALIWVWAIAFFPMAYLILLNVVAGRSPVKLLYDGLGERLDVAAELLECDTEAARQKAARLLSTGNSDVFKHANSSRILSLISAREALRAAELAEASYILLTTVLAHRRSGLPLGVSVDAAKHLYELATDIRARRLRHTLGTGLQKDTGAGIFRLAAAVARIQTVSHVPMRPPPTRDGGFLAPDAFSNPAYVQFALKTLLAVTVTYVTYTAFDWFAIHTAMITCFMVALGSTGETVHKMTLRIAGCLIGAAAGTITILWLMPHMTDIGHLALLVAVGGLAAAWVSAGSERISYMGWQMALCFFLIVLHGFGPTFDLDTARDRILGVVFGNLVVGFVFSTIWPVSVTVAVRAKLSASIAALGKLMARREQDRDAYAGIATGLAGAMRSSELLYFEAPTAHGTDFDAAAAQSLADRIYSLSVPVILLRQREETHGRIMRHVPRSLKQAMQRYEASVLDWMARWAAEVKAGRRPLPDARIAAALRRVRTGCIKLRRNSGEMRRSGKVLTEVMARLQLYEQIAQIIDIRDKETRHGA